MVKRHRVSQKTGPKNMDVESVEEDNMDEIDIPDPDNPNPENLASQAPSTLDPSTEVTTHPLQLGNPQLEINKSRDLGSQHSNPNVVEQLVGIAPTQEAVPPVGPNLVPGEPDTSILQQVENLYIDESGRDYRLEGARPRRRISSNVNTQPAAHVPRETAEQLDRKGDTRRDRDERDYRLQGARPRRQVSSNANTQPAFHVPRETPVYLDREGDTRRDRGERDCRHEEEIPQRQPKVLVYFEPSGFLTLRAIFDEFDEAHALPNLGEDASGDRTRTDYAQEGAIPPRQPEVIVSHDPSGYVNAQAAYHLPQEPPVLLNRDGAMGGDRAERDFRLEEAMLIQEPAMPQRRANAEEEIHIVTQTMPSGLVWDEWLEETGEPEERICHSIYESTLLFEEATLFYLDLSYGIRGRPRAGLNRLPLAAGRDGPEDAGRRGPEDAGRRGPEDAGRRGSEDTGRLGPVASGSRSPVASGSRSPVASGCSSRSPVAGRSLLLVGEDDTSVDREENAQVLRRSRKPITKSRRRSGTRQCRQEEYMLPYLPIPTNSNDVTTILAEYNRTLEVVEMDIEKYKNVLEAVMHYLLTVHIRYILLVFADVTNWNYHEQKHAVCMKLSFIYSQLNESLLLVGHYMNNCIVMADVLRWFLSDDGTKYKDCMAFRANTSKLKYNLDLIKIYLGLCYKKFKDYCRLRRDINIFFPEEDN